MREYLKRLVGAGLAYQAGDILSKGVALFMLPLYTAYVSPAGYGYAETLLTAVILLSIVLRLGVGEAFIRFYYDDADPARRDRIAAGAVAFVLVTTTIAALAGVAAAGPLSRALLGVRDTGLFDLAMLGVWAFTNLEIAYALLRADERTRTYMRASLANVVMTIGLTAFLVVGRRAGAEGLLAGNYCASAVVLVALWWNERRRLVAALRRGAGAVPMPLRRMLAFGLPTVPADASVYALQVADRWYLLRAYSASAAGLYALAAKLATVVFVAVRGFQYAWPPLAYSIEDDAVAARLYSLVTTYYVLATGLVVAGVALLGRWAVRLLLHNDYGAHDALPWLALGWALYGLYLIFVVISGRVRATRRNLPAAFVGLAVNIGCLFALVPPLGISGAGIALVIAYAAMLGAIHLLTRRLFAVPFEWSRLARVLAVLVGVSVAGELLLPTSGAAGFILRARSPGVRSGRCCARVGFFRRRPSAPHAARLDVLRTRLARRRRPATRPPPPRRGPHRAAARAPQRRGRGSAPRRGRAARPRRERAQQVASRPSASGQPPPRARRGACACSGRGRARSRRSAVPAARRSRAARGGSRARTARRACASPPARGASGSRPHRSRRRTRGPCSRPPWRPRAAPGAPPTGPSRRAASSRLGSGR